MTRRERETIGDATAARSASFNGLPITRLPKPLIDRTNARLLL